MLGRCQRLLQVNGEGKKQIGEEVASQSDGVTCGSGVANLAGTLVSDLS